MNQMVSKTPTGSLSVPKLFAKSKGANDALMSGVAVSFPILSIASKQWTVRWKGEERVVTLPPPHDEIAAPWVDVVVLNAQKELSRVYYKDPFGNQRNKPDCWASDGAKPDADVPEPINPVCATCPMSAWGSGGSAIAPKAQACQQRRRLAVVPYTDDLTNEAEGGPMLLSVPPGSLANQRKYGVDLKELELPDGTKDIPYFAIITRLSFEQKDLKGQPIKFPKIKFDYRRDAEGNPLFITDEEAEVVMAIKDGEAVNQIFNSRISVDGGEVADGPHVEGTAQVARMVPKGADPRTPKDAPKAPAPKPVGGHPVGIGESVKNPAAPPPSQRTIKVAEATDEDAEAKSDLGEADVFDELMKKPL